MWIVATHATIFIRSVGAMGLVSSEDKFQVAPSLEPQEVPDWCRETGSWRNGIKDGRLKEVGADGITAVPLQPLPAGATVEEGRPIVIDPTQT
jgi:hypothetical protein